MKLVKTASGKKNKIRISRREWTRIGNQSGWISKKAGTNISYTAVVSLESIASHKVQPWQDLLSKLDIPSDWTIHAHHMTINMGACKDPSLLGQQVELQVVALGKDENVMAVQVESPIKSGNAVTHVTVAVAPGAKPFWSNKLKEWTPISPFSISGVLSEVEQGGNIASKENRDAANSEQDNKQQLQNDKKIQKEQERQKLQGMGFEGAKAHLQQQFPNLSEQAILGKLRGAGLS